MNIFITIAYLISFSLDSKEQPIINTSVSLKSIFVYKPEKKLSLDIQELVCSYQRDLVLCC